MILQWAPNCTEELLHAIGVELRRQSADVEVIGWITLFCIFASVVCLCLAVISDSKALPYEKAKQKPGQDQQIEGSKDGHYVFTRNYHLHAICTFMGTLYA